MPDGFGYQMVNIGPSLPCCLKPTSSHDHITLVENVHTLQDFVNGLA